VKHIFDIFDAIAAMQDAAGLALSDTGARSVRGASSRA
jgi:hypothetical protein